MRSLKNWNGYDGNAPNSSAKSKRCKIKSQGSILRLIFLRKTMFRRKPKTMDVTGFVSIADAIVAVGKLYVVIDGEKVGPTWPLFARYGIVGQDGIARASTNSLEVARRIVGDEPTAH